MMIIGLLVTLSGGLFLLHPLFGRHPSKLRRITYVTSPNFKNGQFQNLIETPQLTDGYTMGKVLWNFLVQSRKNLKPLNAIPVQSIDFASIDYSVDAYYWLGHSSYILIIEGKVSLIDPVLTKNGAPIWGSNVAFKGTTFIDLNQLPQIDYLIITHDHYDHLDYTTIKKIRSKVKQVICGLGVGSHFERWNYAQKDIIEMDWWDTISLDDKIKLTSTPARHFSGRTFFYRNDTLFCSYVIETPSWKIMLGGDSGYGPHFKQIGDYFNGLDFVFLETGQYNNAWHYIHLHPEEVKQTIKDLQVRTIIPVHHSKFALSNHPWKEPIEKIIENRSKDIFIQTPYIGERVELKCTDRQWINWWEDIQ